MKIMTTQGRKVIRLGAADRRRLRAHFRLTAGQLQEDIDNARLSGAGDWRRRLLVRLELRLDNILVRLGLARDIRASRRLIRGGQVVVNGRRLSMPGSTLRQGDHVCLMRFGEAIPRRAGEVCRGPDFLGRPQNSLIEAGTILRKPSLRELSFEMLEGKLKLKRLPRPSVP